MKYKFITQDLPLASFLLTSNKAILTNAYHQGTRVIFELEAETDLDSASMEYYRGKGKVSVLEFCRNMDYLRDIIRRVNSRHDDPEPIHSIIPRVIKTIGGNK